MFAIKALACAALLTLCGISSAEASAKPLVIVSKTHAEIHLGPKIVTLGSGEAKSKRIYLCSAMQGVTYGAALVGWQSTLIVLPSFASGVGAPVGAVATGVGAIATGVGFLTMVVHDMACK